MTDDIQEIQETDNESNAAVLSDEPTSSSNSVDSLPDWAQEMIRSLREEAASRRVALKRQEEANRDREQKRLAEEGKWRELADSRERELASLQPYKERAESLETMLRDSNNLRIARIPEDMRTLVPTDYAPEQLSNWLDTNADRLAKPFAPRLDGGAASGGASAVQLTEEEKQVARATGLSLEEYAKYKLRINGLD